MPPVLLSRFAVVLLVAHAGFSAATLGSAGHIAWLAFSSRSSQALKHADWFLGLLSASAVTGLLLYPHFRVHVREVFLDEHAPWATQLFEVKEHLALAALPLALGYWALAGTNSRREQVVMALILALLVVFLCTAGVVISNVKGV